MVLYFNPKRSENSKTKSILDAVVYKNKIKEKDIIDFYSIVSFPELHSEYYYSEEFKEWESKNLNNFILSSEIIIIVPYWFDLFPSRFISFLHLMISKTKSQKMNWKIIVSFDMAKDKINPTGINYLNKVIPIITNDDINLVCFYQISNMTNLEILNKVINDI